jgi:hypothetical protein
MSRVPMYYHEHSSLVSNIDTCRVSTNTAQQLDAPVPTCAAGMHTLVQPGAAGSSCLKVLLARLRVSITLLLWDACTQQNPTPSFMHGGRVTALIVCRCMRLLCAIIPLFELHIMLLGQH